MSFYRASIFQFWISVFMILVVYSSRNCTSAYFTPHLRKPGSLKKPECSVERMQKISCEIQLFSNMTGDLQRHVEILARADNYGSVPRDVRADATMYRHKNVARTMLMFKFYGSSRSLQKLKGIFAEIDIYQGPTKPLVKRYLLISLNTSMITSSNRQSFFTRIHASYDMAVSSNRLLGEVAYRRLPCSVRGACNTIHSISNIRVEAYRKYSKGKSTKKQTLMFSYVQSDQAKPPRAARSNDHEHSCH